MIHVRSCFAALLFVALTGAAAAEAAPRRSAAARPAYVREALASDLLLSCIPEASAYIAYQTSARFGRIDRARMKAAIVEEALNETRFKMRLQSSPTPQEMLFQAQQELEKDPNLGFRGFEVLVFRACLAQRHTDIQAGSQLRSAAPRWGYGGVASHAPWDAANAGLSNLPDSSRPIGECNAKAESAGLVQRAARLNGVQPLGGGNHRPAIALIDETIAILRPCASDPEAAKLIMEALQSRQRLLVGCRLAGTMAACLAPATRPGAR